jgi:hypothetical protein
MGIHNDIAEIVLDGLPPQFTAEDLEQGIDNLRTRGIDPASFRKTVDAIGWLAHSNYVAVFPPESPMSDRIMFPVSENESRGIEDARFVRFVDDDGAVTYYATYTAFNGFEVLPQMISTPDFRSVQDLDAQRQVRSEQGHGTLSTQARRKLRITFALRRREPAPAAVRQH